MRATSHSGGPIAGHAKPSYPLVSVIIPYYKQEQFVAEAVKSVTQQTYPNVEIIVVDDGSPVPASSVLPGSNDVQILRTPNRGCPAARNFGFQRSCGEYLVFLDSDDRLSPGALEAHLKALAGHPEAVLSFGAQRIIDEEGDEIRPAHICRPRKNYFLMLLEGNPIGCPGATMMRRDAFIEAGRFDESVRIVEDYPLYLRLARRHPLVRLDSWVVDYRFHGRSLSQDKEGMLKGILDVLDRLEAETPLTAYERRRLRHGRSRWRHEFRAKKTPAHRLYGLYYSLRAMSGVPLRAYFGAQDSEGTLSVSL
jgi:glycosyltransferase involved in cell wall biosynthesis